MWLTLGLSSLLSLLELMGLSWCEDAGHPWVETGGSPLVPFLTLSGDLFPEPLERSQMTAAHELWFLHLPPPSGDVADGAWAGESGSSGSHWESGLGDSISLPPSPL